MEIVLKLLLKTSLPCSELVSANYVEVAATGGGFMTDPGYVKHEYRN
jgi:hypothetical protein